MNRHPLAGRGAGGVRRSDRAHGFQMDARRAMAFSWPGSLQLPSLVAVLIFMTTGALAAYAVLLLGGH